MKTVGIICEYNPFHNGHLRQLRVIREKFGQDCGIICLMSGNFVQRGEPAIVDKSVRAGMAVLCGADLVLELPTAVALSSAEGFADGGVRILSRCCEMLCFGTESMDSDGLLQTARALLSPDFPPALKAALASGCSFPAARQLALQKIGQTLPLCAPNDILGVEYTKAILRQGSSLEIFPIHREGAYHAEEITAASPSATAVRRQLLSGGNWESAIPTAAAELLKNAPLHTLEAGERAIVARLRTMTEEEYQQLPYGSEGLWRKLRKAARTCSGLPEIIDAVKSKRYTRTRIDRMILCAFLGLHQEDMGRLPDRIRALAFNNRGRALLRAHPEFCNAGEDVSEAEERQSDLYGLFCIDRIESPGMEKQRRVIYIRETP